MEIILETIIILIFRYPGAGIRWLISRIWKSNKKFKEFLKEDSYLNGIIGLLVLALIIISITYINSKK
tara:strand:- start:372 stop:575 length:204 start_codon:yes stop_codon:yes gene_type:complete